MHALLVPLLTLSVTPSPSSSSSSAPLVIGHRGAPRELPESTLAGFALALVSADAIELDVRVSADGVLVVHHDAVVPSRCGPHGGERIRALSFAALREVACASDPAVPSQRPLPGAQIASLDELLALVTRTHERDRSRRDTRRVIIEIKADDAPAPDVVARLLVASLGRARARSLVVVESFDRDYVDAMRARAPEVARGLLCADDCARALADARALRAILISPAHDRIDAAFVVDAHERGLGVIAWTANDASAWHRLRTLGADGIVTDDPRALRASLPGGP